MSYSKWFESHARKHALLVHQLSTQGYTQEMMIDYFVFENMLEKEPAFCPLYANKQKCHDVPYLNCYFCACPYFRFNDDGLTSRGDLVIKSQCSVASKKSVEFVHENVVHVDCSACVVPHTKAFIYKHFDRDWQKVMQACFTFPVVSKRQ